MSPSVYGIAKPVVAVSLSLICNWEVRNKIDVMPQGPVIVASNHLSWIDIPLLAIVVPRRIAYMAKKEYFHSTFHRVLLQIFGGFTVAGQT